ncbi:hypothetical protein K6119_11355 [Paracrocinitomix mangrovi]|uniref:hypothetical protein n=1 Tax=Paracrocinitomix mangrovi TaxID=2862509 RepID=UPI001C8DA876|nr:hypothetical protein [Paracrocinitomix mangrovi]UKN00331.1 hypothetical protein K6119_11355 [Paracrocinitomix mangrovi]
MIQILLIRKFVSAAEDKICIHSEVEISLYTINRHKLWAHCGKDIFTTPEGKDDFKIEGGKIYAKDWEGNRYVFDSKVSV